jgi:hypothetical protein
MMPKTSQCGASDKAGLVKEGQSVAPHPGPLNSSDDSAGLPGKCGAARGKLRIDRSCSPFPGDGLGWKLRGFADRHQGKCGGWQHQEPAPRATKNDCPCHQFTL